MTNIRESLLGGYNKLIDGLLEGADTKVSVDFFKDEIELPNGNKGVLKKMIGKNLPLSWFSQAR